MEAKWNSAFRNANRRIALNHRLWGNGLRDHTTCSYYRSLSYRNARQDNGTRPNIDVVLYINTGDLLEMSEDRCSYSDDDSITDLHVRRVSCLYQRIAADPHIFANLDTPEAVERNAKRTTARK